jgi:hypothetical protein
VFTAAALIAGGALVADAQVGTRGPALNWVRLPGADGCITPVELANRVEQRLDRRVFARVNDAIVVIEGRVGPATGGGFAVSLRVSDPDGTLYGARELATPSPDCRALDEVTALIIAITIRHDSAGGIELPASVAVELDALFASEPNVLDPTELRAVPAEPNIRSAGSLPAVAPGRASGPATPKAEAATAALGVSPPLAAAWHIGLDAGVIVATGIQPRLALAGALRVTLRREALGSVAISGRLSLPQEQTGLAGRGRIEHRFYAFGLALCPPAIELGTGDLTLCAEGRVGQLRVAPSGFETQRPDSALWVEVGPRALVRVPVVGPSRASLGVALPIRVRKQEFRYVDDAGRSHSALDPTPVGLEVELALGVEF